MLALAGCDTISGIFDSSDTPKLPGKRVSVLAVEQKLKVDKNLATTNVTLPEPVTNRDWSQIGGNASHNLGHLALGNDLHQVWAVDAGEGPQSHLLYTGTPIVAINGKPAFAAPVFLYALTMASGDPTAQVLTSALPAPRRAAAPQ